MVDCGAATFIIKNIAPNPTFINVILKLLGNMLTCESNDLQIMLDNGLLELLENLYLSNFSLAIEKELLWVISNITAGENVHINIFLKSNLCKKLIEKIFLCNKPIIMVELIWIFSNTINSDIEITCQLVKLGILEIFIYILDNFKHEIILMIAFEGLKGLFECGEKLKSLTEKNQIVESFCKLGGSFSLERLQNDERADIYMRVDHIVNEYISNDMFAE